MVQNMGRRRLKRGEKRRVFGRFRVCEKRRHYMGYLCRFGAFSLNFEGF